MIYFSKAKPVFLKNRSEELNVFAVFRALVPTLREATIHLTAASFYRLTVNGKFVAFGPARTAKKYARVDVFDLSPYNAEDENEILIEVAGYHCRSLSTVFQPSFLIAEIKQHENILAATGRDFEAFAPACKERIVERYSRQRHFTEIWDFQDGKTLTDDKNRAEIETLSLNLHFLSRTAPNPRYERISLPGVKRSGILTFDEALPYQKEKYSGGYLPSHWGFWSYDDIPRHPHTWIQRHHQTVTHGEQNFPITLQAGEYAVLDLGHIEVGFLQSKMTALADSEVIFAFTEYDQSDIFSLPNMNVHNAVEYMLSAGDTRETMTFEPYTCRYVMIAVKKGKLTLEHFGLTTFMFDPEIIEIPTFYDKTVNAIYRAAVRTFAHNAVDLYTDCPSRERAGWLCDSYFTGKAEYTLTGKTAVEDAFLENYLCYENEGDLPQGMLPMCYPADVIPACEIEDRRFIPQWTMWYVLECRDYLLDRGHGDKKEAFRKNIYMLLDFYRQYENSDGLLENLPSWNFVEWSIANQWTQDVNYPTNFLYAGVLSAIAELYGDEHCHKRAAEVRSAVIAQAYNGTYFHDHAIRDEKGKLLLQDDASEACQYYAILFGDFDIHSERFAPLYRLVTKVFSPNRNGKMPEIFEVNAFIGAYLRIETLLKLKEYDLLLRDIKDFFGHMEAETGTLWEYREVKGSCDHGFASYAAVALREVSNHRKV